MEVTALCIRLLVTVLLLLIVQVDFSCSQTADEAFPQVDPNRQQHIEYDPIEISCEGLEGLTGWRVMRKIQDKDVQPCSPDWSKSTGPCKITNAFQTSDSGEYWCEMGEKRSNAVNITVTVGRVILESPALPVMEGKTETLRCRSKMTSSAHIADFYKDGFLIGSGSTGEMTIHHVSKADEGFYKCSITDFGDSAESWLAVRALHRETPPPSELSCHPYLILRTIFTILMVVLLLLLVGLLHCGKLRVTPTYVCVCKVCEGKCQTDPDNSVKEELT
ncbi:low affinity immunoglobulin gamma Fc region receptor II-like isoform X2 [Sparus aurata]|uniref:low affinity immunoglobulin gamma Fc region receptor II-like isoform X2 n=1 Tax=Sparus aurata TaxID=8175 RepID=UPI0011C15FD4|nr:low affinity immunoglobulin gamma Fc region receptor II-like isoform X2 [Sparus aurata]